MEDNFDISAAVDDIGSGLGLDSPEVKDDDVELEVVAPAAEAKAEPVTGETPAPETPTAETPSNSPPADPTATAPKTWRKEAAATWAALPSEAKNEILKREADIFSGIESYKVAADFGKSIKSVVAPFEQIMRDNNMDPVRTIGGLLNAHHTLATGSSQAKQDLFLKMAKDYGIDLGGLPSPGEAPYIDPAVAALQNELQSVKSVLQVQTERAYQEQRNIVSKQVDTFASDSSNIYWADVADEMTALLNSRQASTLQEAYDKAVWTNPVVRAKEIARQTTEATAKAQKDAGVKMAAAKAATAANVRTRVRSGSATTPTGSLDDTLEAAMANIKARA